MLNVMELTGGAPVTASVQAAIDRAAAEKRVLFFPRGIYTVTTLTLPSDTSLLLEDGAVIKASTVAEEWRECNCKPLICAVGAENITVRGGTLDGSSDAYLDATGSWESSPLKPFFVLYFRDCRNITVEGVTLTRSVGWTLPLDNCENVLIDGVIIRNPPWNQSHCCDGIDINGCRHVEVKNCDVETGDDGICMKNARGDTPREDMFDIHVHDCRVATTCNAAKIGTETFGNIYDVLVEDITVRRHSAITKDGAGEPVREMINPLAAVSIQSNDGASVHDITFRRFRVEHALTPLLLILQPRNRFVPDLRGEMYNITVEDIEVNTTYRNSVVLAAEGMPIRNVHLARIKATCHEPPSAEYVATVPTGRHYPDIFHFPPFPAYGLFCCNAEVTAEDCDFTEVHNSGRPPVVML